MIFFVYSDIMIRIDKVIGIDLVPNGENVYSLRFFFGKGDDKYISINKEVVDKYENVFDFVSDHIRVLDPFPNEVNPDVF